MVQESQSLCSAGNKLIILNQFNSMQATDWAFPAMRSGRGHPPDDLRGFEEHFKEQFEPLKIKFEQKYAKFNFCWILRHDWNRFDVKVIPGSEPLMYELVERYPKHPLLRHGNVNSTSSKVSDFLWADDPSFSQGPVFRNASIDPKMFDCFLKKPKEEGIPPTNPGILSGQEQVPSWQSMFQTDHPPVFNNFVGNSNFFLPIPMAHVSAYVQKGFPILNIFNPFKNSNTPQPGTGQVDQSSSGLGGIRFEGQGNMNPGRSVTTNIKLPYGGTVYNFPGNTSQRASLSGPGGLDIGGPGLGGPFNRGHAISSYGSLAHEVPDSGRMGFQMPPNEQLGEPSLKRRNPGYDNMAHNSFNNGVPKVDESNYGGSSHGNARTGGVGFGSSPFGGSRHGYGRNGGSGTGNVGFGGLAQGGLNDIGFKHGGPNTKGLNRGSAVVGSLGFGNPPFESSRHGFGKAGVPGAENLGFGGSGQGYFNSNHGFGNQPFGDSQHRFGVNDVPENGSLGFGGIGSGVTGSGNFGGAQNGGQGLSFPTNGNIDIGSLLYNSLGSEIPPNGGTNNRNNVNPFLANGTPTHGGPAGKFTFGHDPKSGTTQPPQQAFPKFVDSVPPLSPNHPLFANFLKK